MKYLKYLWQKLVSPKIELDSYDVPELVPYCHLFGSRLWGGATRKSDVDFIIAEKNIAVVTAILTSLDISHKVAVSLYANTTISVEFSLNDLRYSLNVVEDKHFATFKKCIPVAGEFFKEYPVYTVSKDSRARLFESLIDPHKPYDTNLGNFLKKNYPEFLV